MFKKFSRKKKLTAVLALLATMLMLFTGCVRSGVGVIINDDDTGTVEISMGVAEKLYNAQEPPKEYLEGKNVSKLTDGDDTYICVGEHKEFKNLEELKKILLEIEYDFSWFAGDDSETNEAVDIEDYDDLWIEDDAEESDGEEEKPADEAAEDEQDLHIFKTAEIVHTSSFFSDEYKFAVTTNPQNPMLSDTEEESNELTEPSMDMDFSVEGDMDFDLSDITDDESFRLVVTVTMPGTITSETGEVNGNTVTFTVTDIGEEVVLVAESNSTNIAGIVGVAIAVIVLIVVLILVFGKKKPKNHTFD